MRCWFRPILRVVFAVCVVSGFSQSTSLAQTRAVRVSVKVILDDSGERDEVGLLSQDRQIEGAVDAANEILRSSSADWCVDLVEIVEVPGQPQWLGERNCSIRTDLDRAAKKDPAYSFREDAINVYVVDDLTNCSAWCAFPESAQEIIIIENRIDLRLETFEIGIPDENYTWSVGWFLLHEIGHFFNLAHTQGRSCSSCGEDREGVCNTIPGDDFVEDTLGDLACWDADDIATNHFGSAYDELDPPDQALVEATLYNVMSYHREPLAHRRAVLTPGQLERASVEMDPVRGRRRHVVCQEPCVKTSSQPFRRGDVDENSFLEMSDGIRILSFLFLGGRAPACLDAADADADGELNPADALRVFRFLFLDAPPPPGPFPSCERPVLGNGTDLGCDEGPDC